MSSIAESKASPMSRVAPFYWSLRREVWEHRVLYLAPAAVSALVFVGFLAGLPHLPHALQTAATTAAKRSRRPTRFCFLTRW